MVCMRETMNIERSFSFKNKCFATDCDDCVISSNLLSPWIVTFEYLSQSEITF